MSKRQSYDYGPGGGKKSLSSQDLLGYLLIIAVIAGGAGLAYWKYTAAKSHVDYDLATYCPATGPYARIVLLLDLTDKISFIQEQKLKTFMHALADMSNPDAVPQYTMLSVYLLKETDTDALPAPVVEVCNPGNGEGLNEFTANPRLANKRFVERFVVPVDKAMGGIVQTDSANTSPIIESIRGIAVSAFAEKPREGYEHRLIVISDMLQNTANTSLYRHGQDINKVDLEKIRADLGNVSRVDIRMFARKSATKLQGQALVEYWNSYFRASGSSLSTAERWEE